MDDLPSEFDVIIVGTGLSESILSAAVSRVGHTVLHLDPREYYGGKWATLSWDQLDSDLLSKGFSAPAPDTGTETGTKLEQELNSEKEAKPNSDTDTKTGSVSDTIASEKNLYFERTNCIRNVERQWYESGVRTSADTTNTETDSTPAPAHANDNINVKNITTTDKARISKLSRKFNIDIYPKVVLAREEIIQLLIDSNVSRYLEFKCISKLFVSLPPPLETVIEPVPLSRSDIFTSTSLGLVEKRKLTKFIDLILKSETSEPPTETLTTPTPTPTRTTTSTPTPYEDIIKSSGITDKIQHLIQTSVKNVEDAFDLPHFTVRFVQSFRIFLQSIGRYGNQTPYLWTLYGVGEICQAFCRLSAIYGGIFILKRSVQIASVVHHVKSSENENDSEETKTSHILVTTDDASIKAKYLVLGSDVKPKKGAKHSGIFEETRTVARGVLLTVGGKIKNSTAAKNANEKSEKESSMSVYKIGNMEIIEVDSTSLAVPDPYRLVHVTYPCLSSGDENNPRTIIENALKPFMEFPQSQAETEEETDKAKKVEGENPGAPPRPLVLFGSYFLVDFVDRHPLPPNNENGAEVKSAQEKNRILYCTSKSTGITGEINKAREIFEEMFPGEEFLPKAPDAEAEAEGREEGEAELSS